MDDGVTIRLSGYVQNLRKDINKNVFVVSIAAQKLKDKPHNLCQHWIKHLAMCAYENNVSETRLFGVDTDLVINSIDKDQAKAHLKNIVAAWYQNRNEVLPIAIKSVFAYLKKFDLHDAKTEYEDKFNGCEIEQDLYLKRIFSTFEELTRNGEFEKWATLLYLPIQKNAQEVKK
jgi:exodeoxyribonuclease V gamma subunit